MREDFLNFLNKKGSMKTHARNIFHASQFFLLRNNFEVVPISLCNFETDVTLLVSYILKMWRSNFSVSVPG